MTDWARVASRRLARLGRLGWIAAAVFCGAAALVAEGVEDQATLQALRRYGCNITQGYVHTPPLAAEELLAGIGRCTPQLYLSDLALHPELR